MLSRLALAACSVLAVGLVALTVLPYVETNRWFVRMADFPRLQLLMAILAAMAATAFLLRRHALAAGLALAGLGAAALAHAVTLWPWK
jgi:hypothetical protein